MRILRWIESKPLLNSGCMHLIFLIENQRRRMAERIAAHATGWNDRVVCVEWIGDRGTVNTMVWRSAVTRRSTPGATG